MTFAYDSTVILARVDQVGEDDTDPLKTAKRSDFVDLVLVCPVVECDAVKFIYLRRLIDSFDDSFRTKRDLGVGLVAAVHETDSLSTRVSPEVEDLVDNRGRRELDVVDHAVRLRL